MRATFGMIALLVTFAAAAEADSRWSLDLRAGGAAPTEEVGGADLGTGVGFAAIAAYRVQPHLHVYGGWGWRRFDADASFAAGDTDLEQTGYAYGLRFEHPFIGEGPASGLAYRVHAGGTYEHLEIEAGEESIADSGLGTGWEAGAGIVVPIGAAWRLSPGVAWRSLSRDVTIGSTTTPVRLRCVVFDVGVTRSF